MTENKSISPMPRWREGAHGFGPALRNLNTRCSTRDCENHARFGGVCLPCYASHGARPYWKYCSIRENGERCGRKLHSHKMCQRHADRLRKRLKS